MATATVRLDTGLRVGEVVHLDAEIREALAADVIDGCLESERVVPTDDGPQLVQSPTLVGLHTLRRQIVRIGDHPGPLTLSELRTLTTHDLALLQECAMGLEQATLRQVAARGRT